MQSLDDMERMEHLKRAREPLESGTVDDWPSLALLEFTVGLARLMKANDLSQAALARRLNVSRPYISSVMSGNENLTAENMARLAAAAGGALHIAVTERDEHVRWVQDVAPAAELAPDLAAGTGVKKPARSAERADRRSRCDHFVRGR
jgi:transcriptional regulator with XRE-family HTH domain